MKRALRLIQIIALLVLHEAGSRYDDALVVLRLADFQELWGD